MSHYQTSLRTLEFIVGYFGEHVTGISWSNERRVGPEPGTDAP
jgi:hypothetical protein